MRLLGLLMTLSAVAAAAPDPKLLAKGRGFELNGKHAEAVAAYEAYLKGAPDDAIGNAELGFAALQAKDLAKAEAATKRAIANAPKGAYLHDPNGRTRGAALYNLGLIQQAQNKPKEAATSFKDSQASRASRAVREALQKLDPTLAATADPLAPKRLAGPYKDPDALCRAWLKKVGEDEAATWGEGSSCARPDVIKIAGKADALFKDVRAFQFESRSALEIAVKLDDGWYQYEYEQKGDRNAAHCGGTKFTAAVKMSPTMPQLLIGYTAGNDSCDHDGNGHSRTWGWSETGVIAIGIGMTGKPFGTPPIVEKLAEWQKYDDEKVLVMTNADAKLAFAPDGSLDVSGTVQHPNEIESALEDGDLDGEQLLGHHVLLFP
jgi:Tetratricopeptide repeat